MLSVAVKDEKTNRVIIYDCVVKIKSLNKGIRIWAIDNFSTIIDFKDFTIIEITKE